LLSEINSKGLRSCSFHAKRFRTHLSSARELRCGTSPGTALQAISRRMFCLRFATRHTSNRGVDLTILIAGMLSISARKMDMNWLNSRNLSVASANSSKFKRMAFSSLACFSSLYFLSSSSSPTCCRLDRFRESWSSSKQSLDKLRLTAMSMCTCAAVCRL